MNWSQLFKAQLAVLIALCTVSSHRTYPPSWIEVCKVTSTVDRESKHIALNCSLSGNDQVNIVLKHLNDYTSNLTENISYSANFYCTGGGNLSMSLPMKIDKLVELKIEGCSVLDYINDWNNAEMDERTDSLESLTIINSDIVIDPIVLFSSLNNVQNITKEFTCGHDATIKKITRRNMTMSFIVRKELLNETASGPQMDQVQLINDVLDYKPICRYLHLEELEDSHANTMVVYHVRVVGQNSKFPVLKYLNYSHNNWKEISETLLDWRLTFPQLKYLDLSYNKITEVAMKNRFDVELGEDTIIDVTHNNITVLSVKDLVDWSMLERMLIDIRNNPLDCDCLKQEFIYQVQDEDWFVGDLFKYKYIRNMTCATPPSARGKMLLHLTTEDMGCAIPPTDLTVALVILAVVAFSVVVVIILITRYRKEIKIIIYTRFGVLFPWDVDDKKESKRYDAFVSYSTADEDWVYDVLQNTLEQPKAKGSKPFKLCLHQRDFLGGKTILDNIIDSIENSRHSIVILSNNFIQSIWGMEEFKQAYYQSIVKKHRHLIIVKYEEVSESKMDPMLKRCLKTFTYLDVKDTMFMDRLRFSLIVKNQANKK
ncbi:hypothetical protein SNE40_007562 [Patella caerulea]|uniref:TIR domain-containing protein n=1 Tax=Patella caerulea TaxID=87958 RepID=A0AAN8K670_PATCE